MRLKKKQRCKEHEPMKSLGNLAAALSLCCVLGTYPGPSSAEDWTGFYAGGQIGWMDVEYPTTAPVPGGIFYDGSGSPLGLHAGYNRDFGTLVLGAEVSVDFPSIELRSTLSGAPNIKGVDRVSVIKAKLGYDAGRVLPHILLGYASQKYDNRGSTTPKLTFDGMTYGVGVSYLASPNLIAGVEALWFDLEPTNKASILTSRGSLVSLRLSYRF
jgi:outer membrane immunogenic protein